MSKNVCDSKIWTEEVCEKLLSMYEKYGGKSDMIFHMINKNGQSEITCSPLPKGKISENIPKCNCDATGSQNCVTFAWIV
jgi:ArsR family metal-binding transcriptional regulator